MGENVRRTVKRNSKERDKDAHSGTKCDRQKPLPSKNQKTWGRVDGCWKWLRLQEGGPTTARTMSSSIQTALWTVSADTVSVNFG